MFIVQRDLMTFIAPDCYPFTDRDPFIMEHCPDVYFTGNQPSFQHKLVQGIVPFPQSSSFNPLIIMISMILSSNSIP